VHRITGGANYVGTVLIAAWLVSAAMGPEAYNTVNALFGPSGTPASVLAKVANDVRAVVESVEFREKTKHLGILTWGTTPQELDAWTRKEIVRWAEVAKAANIKVD